MSSQMSLMGPLTLSGAGISDTSLVDSIFIGQYLPLPHSVSPYGKIDPPPPFPGSQSWLKSGLPQLTWSWTDVCSNPDSTSFCSL